MHSTFDSRAKNNLVKNGIKSVQVQECCRKREKTGQSPIQNQKFKLKSTDQTYDKRYKRKDIGLWRGKETRNDCLVANQVI